MKSSLCPIIMVGGCRRNLQPQRRLTDSKSGNSCRQCMGLRAGTPFLSPRKLSVSIDRNSRRTTCGLSQSLGLDSTQTSMKSSGRLGHLQNAKFSVGLRFKIKSGLWTDCSREVGRIIWLVYFAAEFLRPECTSSPSAGSPSVFGLIFVLGLRNRHYTS